MVERSGQERRGEWRGEEEEGRGEWRGEEEESGEEMKKREGRREWRMCYPIANYNGLVLPPTHLHLVWPQHWLRHDK